jgi:hypothetical protein
LKNCIKSSFEKIGSIYGIFCKDLRRVAASKYFLQGEVEVLSFGEDLGEANE